MPLSLLSALALALAATCAIAAHRALRWTHALVVAAAWRAQDPTRCELLDEPAPLYRSRLEAVPQGEQGPTLRVVR